MSLYKEIVDIPLYIDLNYTNAIMHKSCFKKSLKMP